MCAALTGTGYAAVEKAIKDGLEIGPETAPILFGLVVVTLPVALLTVVLALLIVAEEPEWPWRLGLGCGAVWAAGWWSSVMFDPAASTAAADSVDCQTTVQGLALCGLGRGLFMLTRLYNGSFIVS